MLRQTLNKWLNYYATKKNIFFIWMLNQNTDRDSTSNSVYKWIKFNWSHLTEEKIKEYKPIAWILNAKISVQNYEYFFLNTDFWNWIWYPKKTKFDCKWKYIMKDTFIFLLSDHFEVKRSLENVFFKTPI